MTWGEGRTPLPDDEADARRRARYWAWSGTQVPVDPAPPLGALVPGYTCHAVATPAQADFEAWHMRHSVGYDFDHYSRMGDILSLRRDGVPCVTALVADATVVHAVGPGNAMITDEDRAVLQVVCDARGWGLPDNETLQGARARGDIDDDGPTGP